MQTIERKREAIQRKREATDRGERVDTRSRHLQAVQDGVDELGFSGRLTLALATAARHLCLCAVLAYSKALALSHRHAAASSTRSTWYFCFRSVRSNGPALAHPYHSAAVTATAVTATAT